MAGEYLEQRQVGEGEGAGGEQEGGVEGTPAEHHYKLDIGVKSQNLNIIYIKR